MASYTAAQLVRTHVANVIGHTWRIRFERGTYSRAFGTDKVVFDQRLGARQVRVGPPGLDPGLIAEAHARGLRLVLDLVPSHTSDQHPWFQASRSSRGDLKRDWYLWRDPAPDGGPPSGWRNPVVLDAMEAVMRLWLDRGVDGFRVDVIHDLLKDEAFRDDPPNPDFVPGPGADPYLALLHPHSTDPSEVHGLMRWFRYYGDELGMQDADAVGRDRQCGLHHRVAVAACR